jgi:carbamoyl-phosphate synthase small subunit
VVRELIDSGTPMMGICLGHQLIGMAGGATTSRLRFGHHGGNHPVKDLAQGHIHITSQNHEFQVDADSLSGDSGLVVSQVNLNDRSVEGLRHTSKPVFSVQYHPEGAPGPQDNQYVFDKFVAMLGGAK